MPLNERTGFGRALTADRHGCLVPQRSEGTSQRPFSRKLMDGMEAFRSENSIHGFAGRFALINTGIIRIDA
jgi:hypothetical protein